MRLDTLRARVVTWYVGLLAAALVLFGATLYFGVRGYLNTSLQRSLSGEATAIGSTFLAFEEQKGKEWMAGEITEAYAPELSGRFIRIVRRDGFVLYQSGDTRDPVIIGSAIPQPNFTSKTDSFRVVPQSGSDDLRHTSSWNSRHCLHRYADCRRRNGSVNVEHREWFASSRP